MGILGFQRNSVVSEFPISTQISSQLLTLQGSVVHTDMDVISGSTMLLPYSHYYSLGFLAWRNPDFIEYFKNNAIQLELKKGDLLFFSPAIFHAAGSNSNNFDRIVNLLQVSSAFGKTMESVNRTKMTKLIYKALVDKIKGGLIRLNDTRAVWTTIIDGYSFPTNLDLDAPTHSLVSENILDLVEKAMFEKWNVKKFNRYLDDLEDRKKP